MKYFVVSERQLKHLELQGRSLSEEGWLSLGGLVAACRKIEVPEWASHFTSDFVENKQCEEIDWPV